MLSAWPLTFNFYPLVTMDLTRKAFANMFIGPAKPLPGSASVNCTCASEPNADATPNVVLASKMRRRLTAPLFTLELSRLS